MLVILALRAFWVVRAFAKDTHRQVVVRLTLHNSVWVGSAWPIFRPFVTFPWVSTRFLFEENFRYPVWTCRDPISLIVRTRCFLILGIQ